MGSDNLGNAVYIVPVVFQSTLPHGERQFQGDYELTVDGFQSTLPHGERLFYSYDVPEHKQFQSTLPHGERRGTTIDGYVPENISIHAPAWGATYHLGTA